jgi:hypothetical protein
MFDVALPPDRNNCNVGSVVLNGKQIFSAGEIEAIS